MSNFQANRTENPHIVEFESAIELTTETVVFQTQEEALRSPLAGKLFGFPWVQSVTLKPQVLVLEKQDWVEWDIVLAPLTNLLNQHIELGQPILYAESSSSSSTATAKEELPEALVTFEPTPNPDALKFNVNREIADEVYEFASVEDTGDSPLAEKIFGFPWAEGVMIGRDFVTVRKKDWVEWDTLARPLASLIAEHLNSGAATVTPSGQNDVSEHDSDAVKKIKEVLNREIRPAVAQDGGDVVFHKYESQILYLFMKGACAGCPSSTATLKMGIETRIREIVPEVREVVSI